MGMQRTAMSQRSAEPDLTSLEASLRMEELSAPSLWDLIVDVVERPVVNAAGATPSVQERNFVRTTQTFDHR